MIVIEGRCSTQSVCIQKDNQGENSKRRHMAKPEVSNNKLCTEHKALVIEVKRNLFALGFLFFQMCFYN